MHGYERVLKWQHCLHKVRRWIFVSWAVLRGLASIGHEERMDIVWYFSRAVLDVCFSGCVMRSFVTILV